jgi:glycerol-3-phosphate acyltransferase PlsX
LKTISIAIDAMGGDYGLPVVLPACLKAVALNPRLHLILVGQEQRIRAQLKKLRASSHPQISVVHASEVIRMDDSPSSALRNKKDSSMRLAINLVKEGQASACVSAGNTGALMAIARFVLKTLPGIDRPAIISEMPTAKGKTRVIDLGANVDSCAEHLFQFAVMGSALIQAVDQQPSPRIGVLNIGVEEIKGNDQVKHTAYLLSSCKMMNYVGYVEGNQFFTGDVELVVCDGFVGNVALKASEGLARLMLTVLKEAFESRIWLKIIGLLARPALIYLKAKMDPAKYNGASLLGLNGVVVKSHGSANVEAFHYAIQQAFLQVDHQVIELVRDQITEYINQGVLS